MARDHAKILCRIWNDKHFLARPAGAQRAFMVLVSQGSMNYAGVLDLTVGRWARYAPDTDIASVRAALADLDAHRFVVVDYDTEEVLVRSFIRNDGLWRNVRMLRVAIREGLTAQSPRIRRALAEELARLPRVVVPDEKLRDGKPAAEARACQQELDEAVTLLGSAPAAAPEPAPAAAPAAAPSPAPDATVLAAPEPAPSAGALRARADGDGDVVGDGVVVPALGDSRVDLEEGVTEVDAGATQPDDEPPTVPDTPPPPTSDQPRTEAPTAPVHEHAMPSDRCLNHRELATAPPCGRCKEAKARQRAWIADRDARVATARQQAQAEIAAERTARQKAIDDCGRCNDKGLTLAAGVLCAHDETADQVSSGRAEFRTALTQLTARTAAQAKTSTEPPATGDQLRLIAIRFGERGVNDRNARLQVCGEVVGRVITSTRDLTKAEAQVILDRFDHPLPVDEPTPDRELRVVGWQGIPGTFTPPPDNPVLDDDASAAEMEAAVLAARDLPDDDRTEPEPEGDDAFEDEYRRDQATWTQDDDDQPAAVYSHVGGTDEPPF